mgnify:CR=1 FL=1
MKKFSGLEASAVISSLLYTILITYDIIWCWLFSFIGVILYLIICYRKRLYAESFLQIFYLATTVYGFLNWGEGLSASPTELSWNWHLSFIAAGAVLFGAAGYLLNRYSDAATPYLDTFTTVFGILATLLMILLYPSNWLYWIVIDGVSVYLYFQRGLWLSSGLFALYTLLSINGYWQWLN